MANQPSFNDDPAWLMQPSARRQIALKRLQILLDYENCISRGSQEAQQSAKKLGVTTGQFYRIRRQWLRSRSIFDLLPYNGSRATRKPKLDQDVKIAMSNLIIEAVVKDGVQSSAEILRRVQNNWPLEKRVPSHMTIRKNISNAFEKLADVSPGMTILNSRIPKDLSATATWYGEVIAIDHIGLDVFVASEGGPVAPIATVAIDLFTSSIAGLYLSFGAPGPLQFEAALRDATVRSKRSSHSGKDAIKPRLVFNAEDNFNWSKLISRVEDAHHHASIRMDKRLNFGQTITTLIGTSVGGVTVSSRKYINGNVFNPSVHPLISFDDLKKLINDGIDRLNAKRIPADIRIPVLQFDF